MRGWWQEKGNGVGGGDSRRECPNVSSPAGFLPEGEEKREGFQEGVEKGGMMIPSIQSNGTSREGGENLLSGWFGSTKYIYRGGYDGG